LKISQQIGSNPAQIKVQAEWPADAVPVTGLAKVALLAFCFEVEFEGYACSIIRLNFTVTDPHGECTGSREYFK
jgi:hypothetical protein